MKSAYEIIKMPKVTEKGTKQQKRVNKVFFEVDKEANKIEIKRSIEDIFKVKVTKVATMNRQGKRKRVGIHQGRRPGWKKAIITLAEGYSIEALQNP